MSITYACSRCGGETWHAVLEVVNGKDVMQLQCSACEPPQAGAVPCGMPRVTRDGKMELLHGALTLPTPKAEIKGVTLVFDMDRPNLQWPSERRISVPTRQLDLLTKEKARRKGRKLNPEAPMLSAAHKPTKPRSRKVGLPK